MERKRVAVLYSFIRCYLSYDRNDNVNGGDDDDDDDDNDIIDEAKTKDNGFDRRIKRAC